MPLLERVKGCQSPKPIEISSVPPEWRYIVSGDGVDTNFINYLVTALQPLLGDVPLGTFVNAPGPRFHPVFKKTMQHNGWDVVFRNARRFTIDQLVDQLGDYFAVESVMEGFDDRSGHKIKLQLTPKYIEHASVWDVSLCHFNREGAVWEQGASGAATGKHVHIGIHVHGQVA